MKSTNREKRPVNLALWSFAFPLTAIVSIAHRITGVVLFLAIPWILGSLQGSLHSEAGFHATAEMLRSMPGKWIALGVIAAWIYHVVAGLRHLGMDLHWFITRESGRCSAQWVIGISSVLIGIAGWAWLW